MTQATRLPSSLSLWLKNVLGPLNGVRDASHARDDSHMWKVSRRAGGHYVKVVPKPILYTREPHAYRVAVQHLGHGNAPSLLALILTAVDGEPLKGTSGSATCCVTKPAAP
jgi:hypothetical protein